MPYIEQHRREYLDPITNPKSPGDLNFVFTTIALHYFRTQGGRYQQINDVIGALECAKQEFYRRLAVPYEECKRAEHGDVY